MFKRRKIVILIVALIIAAGLLFMRSRAKVIQAEPVTLTQVVVRKTVSASGTVTSLNKSDMSVAGGGQLQNVYIKKGQEVTKGQLLANVYNYDSSQSAQASKDARDVAKKDLELYIENYQNNQAAVGGSEEYRINVKRLEELLSKAEATYQASLGSLSKTALYAPFSGTVVDILADVGEVVTAGAPILKLADLNALIFDVNVDQEDFGLLKLGQPAEITLDSYEGVIFGGKVVELPKYAQDETSEFEVKIEINSTQDQLPLPGMKGDASIIIAETSDEVNALTFDSIFFNNGDKPFVWVSENGRLAKKEIDTGLEGDVYTELKTDLSNIQIVLPTETDAVKAQEGIKINIVTK